MLSLYQRLLAAATTLHRDQRGLNTAELLGNAALAIAALVAIWSLLQALGVDIVNWVRTSLPI